MSIYLVIDSLVLGGKIALAAIPYLLVYKYLRMLNFAFGELMTFGALAALVVLEVCNWPLWAAILVAMLLTASLGALVELFAYRRVLAADDRHLPLVSSVGVSIFLQNVYQAVFGSRIRYVDRLDLDIYWLYGTLVAVLLVNHFILQKTRLGDEIAAVASNRTLAKLEGIRTGRVYSLVFALGSAAAALAGIFEMADNGVNPTMGFQLGLLAFAAAVLARLRSMLLTVACSIGIGFMIQFTQTKDLLNDRLLWVLFVLFALAAAAVSRAIGRRRRIAAGKDLRS